MIPNILNKFEYAGISIPMAVLIWIMIYPMMIKVDFKSVKYISKNPKGLFVTWIVNWLIKPFTMYGIACLFFFVLFRAFIPVELATEYLAGAVLLGAAPCTAMVFVWSSLTQGNPVYTVVQVATNDIIILFAFGPIVKFLLGVSNVAVPFNTIFLSVVLFVVIPLVGGIITRMAVIRKHDENYLNQQFLNKFDSVTTIGLAGTPTAVTQFSKVLNTLRARHKYGLSATVHRADGLIKATYAMLGHVIYTVPDEAVKSRVMMVDVQPKGTGVKLDSAFLNSDGTINYCKMITYLTTHTDRNQIMKISEESARHLDTAITTMGLPAYYRPQKVTTNCYICPFSTLFNNVYVVLSELVKGFVK